MMCANSADHKLRMASKAEGVERWLDNGNAEQGPCSFGQSVSFVHAQPHLFSCTYSTLVAAPHQPHPPLLLQSYGNLAVWDVCSAFADGVVDQSFRTQPVAVHGHVQSVWGRH